MYAHTSLSGFNLPSQDFNVLQEAVPKRNVLGTTVENGEFCQRSGGLICDIQCNFETGLGLALDGLTMNGLGNSVLAIADLNHAGLGFNVSARSVSGLCDPGELK